MLVFCIFFAQLFTLYFKCDHLKRLTCTEDVTSREVCHVYKTIMDATQESTFVTILKLLCNQSPLKYYLLFCTFTFSCCYFLPTQAQNHTCSETGVTKNRNKLKYRSRPVCVDMIQRLCISLLASCWCKVSVILVF